MSEKNIIFTKKLIVFFAGLFVYAFGACLMTKANIGISPITSVAYVTSQITGATLGATTFVMNIVLIVLQMLILGKAYEKKQLVQIFVSVVFSIFVDITMIAANYFAMSTLIGRGAVFTISLFIMAIGISCLLITDLFMLPGDAVAKSITQKWGLEFGKAKVITDCTMVATTIIISLVFLHKIIGIQVGTVVTALALGNIARVVIKKIKAPIYQFLGQEIELKQ